MYALIPTPDCVIFIYETHLQTLANRLELLPLEGKARAITEKHDELQSIPHSFAIEFNDGTMQLFFCDTPDDKELLISAILQVTKL